METVNENINKPQDIAGDVAGDKFVPAQGGAGKKKERAAKTDAKDYAYLKQEAFQMSLRMDKLSDELSEVRRELRSANDLITELRNEFNLVREHAKAISQQLVKATAFQTELFVNLRAVENVMVDKKLSTKDEIATAYESVANEFMRNQKKDSQADSSEQAGTVKPQETANKEN